MHIPECATNELEILSFDEALQGRREDYDRSRWLYVPDHYLEYRYILGTKGKKPLICIGINPSTAEPDNLDNTLKSVERIALGNGFDSFIMFNVYAQRATRPKDMERTCNAYLHGENMKAFEYVLSKGLTGSITGTMKEYSIDAAKKRAEITITLNTGGSFKATYNKAKNEFSFSGL